MSSVFSKSPFLPFAALDNPESITSLSVLPEEIILVSCNHVGGSWKGLHSQTHFQWIFLFVVFVCFLRYLEPSILRVSEAKINFLVIIYLFSPYCSDFLALVGQQTSLCFPCPPRLSTSASITVFISTLYFCHLIVFLFLYSLLPLESPLFCRFVGSRGKHLIQQV